MVEDKLWPWMSVSLNEKHDITIFSLKSCFILAIPHDHVTQCQILPHNVKDLLFAKLDLITRYYGPMFMYLDCVS